MAFPAPRRSSGPRVVVVGAGVIGLCCALEIARGGGAVTVIDADAAPASLRIAPRAAAFAAAGMLGAFSEALHEGPGHHRRLSDLCWEGLKSWRTLVASDPELSGFVRFNGALLLAHDEADAARVSRAADRAKRHGAPYEKFEGLPPGLDGRLYGAKVKLSVRLPGEGAASVEPTLARLAEMALSFGASIVREREVVEVAASNDRVSGVHLDDGGALPADIVVLATGALAPASLVAGCVALQRLTPAKGMLGGAPAPQAFDLAETVRTPRIYFGREGEQIFFGATSEPGRADLDADPEAIAALHLEVRRTLPGARFDLATTVLSVGLRPLSPDGAPLVGRTGPDGLIVAVGHGRNGWLLAPVTGVAVAALASGVDPAPVWRDFTPDRFA
ncbi:MAG: FAD-dependent oxidoreductase [Hyphomonadaceae bacterium]|nr:MAG: glycine oxidase [Caulobacteraceae bacterium]MBT9447519.1 FAD-dependent oxidoreductase [Hyphomonadaceae bacterium]TPW01625.1 MAG: glycine oxidase [Alphaproteobacteria bacterium]